MPPELAAAIVGLLVAATQFVAVEVRARAARRRMEAHVQDVKAKVGADRRAADTHR